MANILTQALAVVGGLFVRNGSVDLSNSSAAVIKMKDNVAAALTIEEASNAYMTFVTTNSGEQITLGKALVVPTGGTLLKLGAKTPFAGADFDRVSKIAVVTLAALDTGGGVFSWANPESGSIFVTRVVVDITTKSNGGCTLDIGTTAASAATLSDNLIDGIDVGSNAAVFDNVLAATLGTNGATTQKLATGKWVTGSMASGAAAGLVGKAYIFYHLI